MDLRAAVLLATLALATVAGVALAEPPGVSFGQTEVGIQPGGSGTVDVLARNVSEGVGSFEVTVRTGSPAVGAIEEIAIAGDPAFSVSNVSEDGSRGSASAAGLSLAGDPVRLATVTLSGPGNGTATVALDVASLGDPTGRSYDVRTGPAADRLTVTVSETAGDSGGPVSVALAIGLVVVIVGGVLWWVR